MKRVPNARCSAAAVHVALMGADVCCRSERVYSHVFRLLNEYNVALDSILLKPNMCLPGKL